MKALILCLSLALPASSFAESCTGSLLIGDLRVNGACMNSSCHAIWSTFLSTTVNCGAISAAIEGQVGGVSTGNCMGNTAQLQIGAATVALTGRCSDGKIFSGEAIMSGASGTASCQPTGPIGGSLDGGFAQVIGNCS